MRFSGRIVPTFEPCPSAHMLQRTKRLTRGHNRRMVQQEDRLRENKEPLRLHIFATVDTSRVQIDQVSDMHQWNNRFRP
jgi:hypothetical protein